MKFTEPTKKRILEVLRVGGSRTTAAHIAGVGHSTLDEWVREGKDHPESPKGKFLRDMQAAEGHPRERALGIIYREMENNPSLAWKFIERREPGFAPPMPVPPQLAPQQPVVIQLALHDGSKPALEAVPEIIEGEYAEDGATEAGSPPA